MQIAIKRQLKQSAIDKAPNLTDDIYEDGTANELEIFRRSDLREYAPNIRGDWCRFGPETAANVANADETTENDETAHNDVDDDQSDIKVR